MSPLLEKRFSKSFSEDWISIFYRKRQRFYQLVSRMWTLGKVAGGRRVNCAGANCRRNGLSAGRIIAAAQCPGGIFEGEFSGLNCSGVNFHVAEFTWGPH